MTNESDEMPVEPENAAEDPSEEPKRRFDPFTNEGDMFKIVLGVGGFVVAVAIVALIAGAIF